MIGDLSAAVAEYQRRGWALVPILAGAKRPVIKEWQNRRYSAADFRPGGNVAGILGVRSGSLVDIDLDCAEALAYLRRFEHFKGSKCLILLRWTPEGRHYSGVGGAGALAVILGGGWAGSSSFSLFSKRLSSGSGSV